MQESLTDILALVNDILQAAIVIFGVAVALYNLPHSFRDRVTRAFNSLLFFVAIVYFAELMATRASAALSTENWIRLGWIGIAMVPAAQFHLADALLVTTGLISGRRRLFVRVAYLTGMLFFLLALFTDNLVNDLISTLRAPHLDTGGLFPLFTIYYWLVSSASVYNVWRARLRCVTKTTRRRMTVIFGTYLAAPMGVFPYLLLASNRGLEDAIVFWVILVLGNVVISLMFAFMTYYISYFGATSPDRVVRVRLFKFMARVPLTATLVLIAFVSVSRVGPILGLPVETGLAIIVVATVLLVEWLIHALKRWLERLFQLTDEPEVRSIQALSERLLTTRDLRQFLESILVASCEVLRTPTAFIASVTQSGAQLEAIVGPLSDSEELWNGGDLLQIAESSVKDDSPDSNLDKSNGFVLWRDFWIRPLHKLDSEILVGIFGVKARAEVPDLDPDEYEAFMRLTSLATEALEDRALQQEVFAAVERLLPQVTDLQLRRSAATFGGAPVLTSQMSEKSDLATHPDFNSMVRDALSHYWGGPKLTESPLLRLQVVQSAIREQGGNPTKALRDILARAVDQQKPDGERSMTTAEWILYNILELKFIQGQRVRDVARRLAMSESDLYRKQRVAIENVAHTIARMEEDTSTDIHETRANEEPAR